MKSILLRVPEKIPHELDQIQDEEGLGNRTSTITFLIKYYFLTKKRSLDESIDLLEKVVEKMDFKKIPPFDEQLKDV